MPISGSQESPPQTQHSHVNKATLGKLHSEILSRIEVRHHEFDALFDKLRAEIQYVFSEHDGFFGTLANRQDQNAEGKQSSGDSGVIHCNPSAAVVANTGKAGTPALSPAALHSKRPEFSADEFASPPIPGDSEAVAELNAETAVAVAPAHTDGTNSLKVSLAHGTSQSELEPRLTKAKTQPVCLKQKAQLLSNALVAAQGWKKDNLRRVSTEMCSVDLQFIQKDMQKTKSIAKKIVGSPIFSALTNLGIILNGVLVGWRADQNVRYPFDDEMAFFQLAESFFLLLLSFGVGS